LLGTARTASEAATSPFTRRSRPAALRGPPNTLYSSAFVFHSHRLSFNGLLNLLVGQAMEKSPDHFRIFQIENWNLKSLLSHLFFVWRRVGDLGKFDKHKNPNETKLKTKTDQQSEFGIKKQPAYGVRIWGVLLYLCRTRFLNASCVYWRSLIQIYQKFI